MYTTTGDPAAAAVLLVVAVVVEWLLIYTAVRAAISHSLDRRRPIIETETTAAPGGVRLALVNKGTAPAFDVVTSWEDNSSTGPLAQTPMLPIDGRLECNPAVSGASDGTQAVRFLKVEWRPSPDPIADRRQERRAVLVPSHPPAVS